MTCCHVNVGLAPCSLSWRYQLHQTNVKSPRLGAPTLFSQKGTKTSWSQGVGKGRRDLIWIRPTEQRQTWIAWWSFMKVIRPKSSVPTWLHGWKKGIMQKLLRLLYFTNVLHTWMNQSKTKNNGKPLALIPCKIVANLSNSWCPSLPCLHFVTSGGRGPLKRSWFLSAVKSGDVDR